jgi:hypothetical protein
MELHGVPSWSCSKAAYKLVWHVPLLSEQWINSWWWTEELSETCRLSCQNKFVKLVHLIGFIIKKFVTMQHGHTNVKFVAVIICLFNLTLPGLYNHTTDFFFAAVTPQPVYYSKIHAHNTDRILIGFCPSWGFISDRDKFISLTMKRFYRSWIHRGLWTWQWALQLEGC